MLALVLTYDRNRAVCNHMIDRYAALWPKHPFQFLVPHQNALELKHRVTYIHSPPGIRDTMATLLSTVRDDETIYWCMDDKYPMWLNVRRIEQCMEYAQRPEVNGVLCCRAGYGFTYKYLTGNKVETPGGEVLLEQNIWQIWPHQFIKAGVLRSFFEPLPETIDCARAMDVLKEQPVVPRKYVVKDNRAVFAESLVSGKLTSSCAKSMKDNLSPLPEWFDGSTEESVFYGAYP